MGIGGGWLNTKQYEKNIFDKFRLGQKFRALCPVLLAEPEFRLGKKNDVIFEVLAAWNNFTPPKCAAISEIDLKWSPPCPLMTKSVIIYNIILYIIYNIILYIYYILYIMWYIIHGNVR
jgi:hypothetical protein